MTEESNPFCSSKFLGASWNDVWASNCMLVSACPNGNLVWIIRVWVNQLKSEWKGGVKSKGNREFKLSEFRQVGT